MKTLSNQVFACYSRACAPPPVGTGGSSKGGRGGVDRARAAAKSGGLDKSYLKTANKDKLAKARERNAWKAKQAGEALRRGRVGRAFASSR